MATGNPLLDLPGLGGYLGMQQFQAGQSQQALGALLQMKQMDEQVKARQLQAQAQAQHGLLYQAQIDKMRNDMAEEAATKTRLTGLQSQFDQLTSPRSNPETSFWENQGIEGPSSIQTPGMSERAALEKILPRTIFDPNKGVRDVAGRVELGLLRGAAGSASGGTEVMQKLIALRDQLTAAGRHDDAKAVQGRIDILSQGHQAMINSQLLNITGDPTLSANLAYKGIHNVAPGGELVPLIQPRSGAPVQPQQTGRATQEQIDIERRSAEFNAANGIPSPEVPSVSNIRSPGLPQAAASIPKPLYSRDAANAQEKQVQKQTIVGDYEEADKIITRMISQLQKGGTVGLVGLPGLASQGIETVAGTVNPSAQSPAIDIRSEKERLIEKMRSLATRKDSNFSNKDAERAENIMGLDRFLSTPGSAVRALTNIQNDMRRRRVNLGGPALQSPSNTTQSQFEVGKLYEDASGNKATYRGNGVWE